MRLLKKSFYHVRPLPDVEWLLQFSHMSNDLGPKVSIITPAFNDAPYLRKAIESVLAQTYENWELLIIDDASQDDSLSIAKSYSSKRIRVFHNPDNRGAAYSRNIGLLHASGDYIAFLDGDDWWEPSKLEEQVGFMQKLGIRFSCTAYYRINQDGSKSIITAPYVIGRSKMLRCDYVGCLTAMYDANFVGLIQISPKIKKRNDYAVWLHVSEKALCYYLAKPLASYRVREGSVSRASKWNLLRCHKELFRTEFHFSWLRSWIMAVRNGWHVLIKKRKYVEPENAFLINPF